MFNWVLTEKKINWNQKKLFSMQKIRLESENVKSATQKNSTSNIKLYIDKMY